MLRRADHTARIRQSTSGIASHGSRTAPIVPTTPGTQPQTTSATSTTARTTPIRPRRTRWRAGSGVGRASDEGASDGGAEDMASSSRTDGSSATERHLGRGATNAKTLPAAGHPRAEAILYGVLTWEGRMERPLAPTLHIIATEPWS